MNCLLLIHIYMLYKCDWPALWHKCLYICDCGVLSFLAHASKSNAHSTMCCYRTNGTGLGCTKMKLPLIAADIYLAFKTFALVLNTRSTKPSGACKQHEQKVFQYCPPKSLSTNSRTHRLSKLFEQQQQCLTRGQNSTSTMSVYVIFILYLIQHVAHMQLNS